MATEKTKNVVPAYWLVNTNLLTTNPCSKEDFTVGTSYSQDGIIYEIFKCTKNEYHGITFYYSKRL